MVAVTAPEGVCRRCAHRRVVAMLREHDDLSSWPEVREAVAVLRGVPLCPVDFVEILKAELRLLQVWGLA